LGTYGENFVQEFFKRTLYNLKCYDELHKEDNQKYPNNVTQLINSFLGLIVFVREDNLNLTNEIYENFKDKIQIWKYEKNPDTHELLRHLRNSTAHGRLKEKIDNHNNIIGLTFKDKIPKDEEYKFEMELSVKEIRKMIDLINKEISIE
jgi:hypothetical protein